jgi:hypothetical protein
MKMSLPLSCQSAVMKKAGTQLMFPPCILAPESALGSHSCVALSSAQATKRLPKMAASFRVLFSMRQRITFRVLFCLSQRGSEVFPDAIREVSVFIADPPHASPGQPLSST